MNSDVDYLIIGAGVVGLAIGRALALGGRDVLIVEAEGSIGTGTSSRNSEVIHAGLYYVQGSLKARACVRGRDLLYEFARSHGVAHQRCGKLIVASEEAQLSKLNGLYQAAQANGVHDVVRLSQGEARVLEPEVQCVAALFSPSTGIIDSHGLMLALQGDFEAAGGMIAFCSKVEKAKIGPPFTLTMHDGTSLTANHLINAAGHGAPRFLKILAGFNQSHNPQQYFAKGHYFSLSGKQPFSHLVYPLPVAAGLGIHATLDLQGRVRFGPDVEWVADDSNFLVDTTRMAAFEASIRAYWPSMPHGALEPAYTGIRPKIHSPDQPMLDFRLDDETVHGTHGLINLLGIESPGLTAALALAEEVKMRLA